MSELSPDRISAYPPFVRDEEARRRWRLVTCSALLAYGYEIGQPLSSDDRALVWCSQRALYASELLTGDGDLLEAQRIWLIELDLI
jgi:hypothetical protein